MANKAERQLKELRRLMPWNWDSKVEEHPPGEKAMHDFEDVLAYNLDRRRRVLRPPSPAKPTKQQAAAVGAITDEPAGNNKGPVRKPRLTPALSPKDENVNVPNSTGVAHQGKVNSEDGQDQSLPKSTARHPAPSPAEDTVAAEEAHQTRDALPLGSPDSTVAGVSTVPTTAFTATANATGAKPHVTPANRRKAIQTPSSRPSTSRNHAALADGQFQPTPRTTSTPATVIATARHKANTAGSFRSPQPRTVFGNKRKAATSMEESKIGGNNNNNNHTSSIAHLATASPLAAAAAQKVASAGRNKKPHQQVTREPLEPLSFNLNQYKKGPVINRPGTCPPLFKTTASAGVLGQMPPLPAPSAQKTSQAAALSGHFFSQEKGLVAFMSDKKKTSEQQKHQQQYPGLAPRPPMSLVVPAIMPLVTDKPPAAARAPAPVASSTLGWAFTQLRQQQQQAQQ